MAKTPGRSPHSGHLGARTLEISPDFRRRFEEASEAILVLDLQTGHICEANTSSCRFLGLQREALVGRAFWELSSHNPESLKSVFARLQKDMCVGFDGMYVDGPDGKPLDVEIGGHRCDVSENPSLRVYLRKYDVGSRMDELRYTLSALIESSSDAIIGKNLQGVITSWNPAAEKIFGYTAQEMIGHSVLKMIPTRLQEEEERILREVSAGRIVEHFETRRVRKDGREIDVSITVSPIKGLGGRIIGVSKVARNITRRKRAEDIRDAMRLLSEANGRAASLDELFTAMHQILARVMPTKNIFVALHDVPTDQLSYPYVAEEKPEAHSPKRRKGLMEYVLRTGSSLLCSAENYRQLAAAGEVEEGKTFANWLGVPLQTGGRTVGVVCVWDADNPLAYRAAEQGMLEYTAGIIARAIDRKRNEAMSTLRLRVMESSANAIMIADRTGNITWINPAFTQLTGYESDEVIGQNTRLLKSGKQSPLFYKQMWATLLRGETWRGELVNRKKNGDEYTEETTITPVKDDRGRISHFIAIRQDVSSARRLEKQARQAQKMEAIGQLTGGIAHDFNNVLAVITGYTELLQLRAERDKKDADCLNQIRTASLRAADLIRQLLAFSRQQILKPVVLDVNASVTSMQKMLERLLGEDIVFSATLAPDLGEVTADPTQMEQILMNLSANARDAMPQGGKLSIETANVAFSKEYTEAHYGAPPTGDYVLLAVTDSGVGMDKATQERIFEPFYTTKEDGKGTGLGLSTVYGIVKQSEGFIWVYSELGLGTTFKIYLPRLLQNTLPVSVGREPTSQVRGGGETILLVEDSAPLLEVLSNFMTSAGYHVIAVNNPAEALRLVATGDQKPSLLVTDLVLPGMSGRVLANHLKETHPEIRVIFMSGYTEDAVLRYGVSVSRESFLQKPFNANALLVKIRENLDAD